MTQKEIQFLKEIKRKNQICDAGQQYLDSMDEFQRYHTYPREAFISGAMWSDEHPNPDMINKQEFIEKACTIYRKHLTEFNPMLKEFTTALDEAVSIFKKQLDV